MARTFLAGKIDSMEDFKRACEQMNEKDREEREGHRGRGGREGREKRADEEEEEEEKKEGGKVYREGKQPMCCRSDDASVVPDVGNLLPRAVTDNMCTDLEG
ncbi:hypothetical protein yc1106_06604 [Curvularia clavata]|uniref:Uncharacterized protein n=1 Tax=Curvularia clavata TaxID=95742 RepID=A0A9Q9DUT4_CURCL|nr:hypothetical protein yc1106_06604 [Curvularia clavata]